MSEQYLEILSYIKLHFFNLILIILTISFTIFLFKKTKKILLRFSHVESNLPFSIKKIIKLILWIISLLVVLSQLGVDVSSVVTGLGLTGFALGFAFKDIISNCLAGVLIIIFRSFKKGDNVIVNITPVPIEGRVSEISVRYTILDNEEKTVYVPNSLLVTNIVTVKKTNIYGKNI
jgi:small conductance mechanosensitive channel